MTTDEAVTEKAAARATGLERLQSLQDGARGGGGFRASAWLSMLLIAGFVGWASTAELDEVAIATGEVIPNEKIKVVQHLEGGIIQELMVEEGSSVKKGQALMHLRLGATGVSREELQVELDGLMLTRARLRAEIAGSDPDFGEELLDRRPELADAERATLEARRSELKSLRSVISEQILQREQEVKELEAELEAVTRNLALGREKLRMSADLLRSGLTPKLEHLEMRGEVEDMSGERNILDQAIPRAKSALAEARARMGEEEERFRRRSIEELNEVEQRISRVRESFSEASDRELRTEIKSPIDGIVKNLRLNTIGGVVRPGETILDIVPIGDELVIQARLHPIDRGYVQQGQRAVVKISTYDFVRYGGLEGLVTRIAADTNTDQVTGEPFYEVIVRTEKPYLGDEPGDFPITPGMEATVDIHTGTRSVLDYLIKPILKLRHEAFRER